MEFLVLLFLVSGSLLLPSLGLAVSGQEAHEPSQSGVHVSVTPTDLPVVSASVLGAESWLRTHVLAHYPTERITSIVVGHGVACNHGQKGLVSVRLSHAVKNLHHSLVRWGLAEGIKVTTALTACAKDRGVLKRRLYGRQHLPPALAFPPPPGVSLSFAPNSPPEVVPSVPPAASAPASSPVAVPAGSGSPPASTPASPPEVAGGMAPSALPSPCLAPSTAAMSPPPPMWCVAKPTVSEKKLQEAMDYACGQDGVDCQEIATGGSCFYPANIPSHASYAFNSYWQKTKQIDGSCDFGGTAVLIDSDPSMASLTSLIDVHQFNFPEDVTCN